MSTENPVVWFEIYVDDMERAKRFYEKTFQLSLSQLPSPSMEIWAFPMKMEKNGAAGALAKMEGVKPGGGGTLIYFSCEDCAVEAKRASDNGGSIHMEKTSIDPYGFVAIVQDTEGNMIGLHSTK